MPQPAPQPSLKGRALRALAAREYARAELERKLAPHVQNGEDLGAVLDELTAKGFISDARAAQSVVHRRGQKLGAARVLHELRQKGVEPEAMAAAAVQLNATELERAVAVWRKKFDAPAANSAERAQQMRFLAARGFAPDTIRRVVRAVGDDVDAADF